MISYTVSVSEEKNIISMEDLFTRERKKNIFHNDDLYDVKNFINMEDITKNTISLRVGKSLAVLILTPETIQSIKSGKFPFQSCFSQATGAGLLASKNTGSMLPRSHGASLDECRITYEIMENEKTYEGLEKIAGMSGIIIYGEGKSIGRSNIVMEMMVAVSVTALSLYDMLKSLDEEIEIYCIKSLNRNIEKKNKKRYKSAILICSDDVYKGSKQSHSGETIQEVLENYKAEVVDCQLVPEERKIIQEQILEWVDKDIPYIFTTGGTSLSKSDETIEAIKEILEHYA
ncbi:MAG: molybdopterin-binding protein, partial [Bacteroidota bacterium]|nr:molybdopterin-binding protein [Bacteroidota bacterium]